MPLKKGQWRERAPSSFGAVGNAVVPSNEGNPVQFIWMWLLSEQNSSVGMSQETEQLQWNN